MASASNSRYYSHHHHHRLYLHPQTPNHTNPNPNNEKNATPLRLRADSSDMAEPNNHHHYHNNNNSNNNNASSSSSAAAAMAIDGSEEDSALSRSEFLTRQEVLRRRTRRVKQLANIYRDHYWSMMEELKLKYREYYWEYGKSPFQEEEGNHHPENLSNLNQGNSSNGKLGLGLGLGANVNPNRCEVHGCKMKAMALTRFCHSHILSDAKQRLYKGCTYATKSSPTGPTLCMKPILRSTVPSLCPLHSEKAEKHLTRALRKAGLNVTSMSKLAPKFHVVVAEYVHQIQSKRRAAQKSLVDTVENKEGNTI